MSSKNITYYEIHAFSEGDFLGNPAGICPLDAWLSDEDMQFIAASNNLSETVFFVPEDDGYKIRFFTPNKEVDLCGHGTLASAWVLFELYAFQTPHIHFYCRAGTLVVRKVGLYYQMSLPILPFEAIILEEDFLQRLNHRPKETYRSTYDVLCVYEHPEEVESICIDASSWSNFAYRGIIITAPGIRTDVYSRCFFPGCDVFEDPVTGSAHAVLTPYWCKKLNQAKITAEQGFKRRGALSCALSTQHVLIDGQCKLYLEGTLFL